MRLCLLLCVCGCVHLQLPTFVITKSWQPPQFVVTEKKGGPFVITNRILPPKVEITPDAPAATEATIVPTPLIVPPVVNPTVAESKTLRMYIFGATWCEPCRDSHPNIALVANARGWVHREPNATKSYAEIVYIDIDKYPELAKLWKIERVPTVIIHNNYEELERRVAAFSANDLTRLWDKHSRKIAKGK